MRAPDRARQPLASPNGGAEHGGRMRHPFADQFGDEMAWRFGDVLAGLAGSARHEVDFVRRIEAVRQALAARRNDMAEAWAAFVARWSQVLVGQAGIDNVAEYADRLIGSGGIAAAEAPHASPRRPYVREVLPRAFDQRPAPVPDGWVAEPIGHWAGRPAEVVYDPRRHRVSVAAGPSDLGTALEAAGWRREASDGRRSLWVADKLATARAALERLDHAAQGAGIDATGPAVTGPELAR